MEQRQGEERSARIQSRARTLPLFEAHLTPLYQALPVHPIVCANLRCYEGYGHESKCIEVDDSQSFQSEARLNNDQRQALTALHRTLLHEHHDFSLTSQYLPASRKHDCD
ncbi:hypothetical protein F5Y10DRAFT_48596 [Nemania abortiva]|nr:hypothetical protein F5Y10DRAFT_48596 [Nemania abortiva]